MHVAFYICAGVAVLSTAMVITRLNAVHALLYLIVSLLAVAVIFFLLGAPFAAALEVIIYAGAIMALFVFAIMILNLGSHAVKQEHEWQKAVAWLGPCVLAILLMVQLIYVIRTGGELIAGVGAIEPKAVARSLYGPYMLCVELALLILLSGLVGAYHLARRSRTTDKEER